MSGNVYYSFPLILCNLLLIRMLSIFLSRNPTNKFVHHTFIQHQMKATSSNPFEIQPKSIQKQGQASQNPSRFDLAVPNRCQIDTRSSKSEYLTDFGGALWRSKCGENHQILMKIQTAFQQHGCMLIFTNFSVIWGPQNVPKIKTFFKFV